MVTKPGFSTAYTNVATFCVHGCRLPCPDQEGRSARFIMLSPPPTSWQQDTEGRLILFRLPPSINLYGIGTQSKQQCHLASLPCDIHYLILDHLHPIDRVCLALSCKSLCASVITAPALTATTWTKFTAPCSGSCRGYSEQAFMPDIYSLTLRLAYGWIDQLRYRYCWKCHRILTRQEEVWRDRLPESRPGIRVRFNVPMPWSSLSSTITTTKQKQKRRVAGAAASALDNQKKVKLPAPKWSVKTCVDLQTWEAWSPAQRYDHLVKTWCFSPNQDSSSLACEYCRAHNPTGILDGACGSAIGSGAVHPVECPTCLKRELTWVWKEQCGRPFRPFSWTLRGCGQMLRLLLAGLWYFAVSPWLVPVLVWHALEWVVGVPLGQVITDFASEAGKWVRKVESRCHGKAKEWWGRLRARKSGLESAC